MNETEYNEKLKVLEADHEAKKRALIIECAKSNEIYKIGDIIIDDRNITILIDKITAYKSFGKVVPVYNGVELTKALIPKKNGDRGSIYGNNNTKLIKQ